MTTRVSVLSAGRCRQVTDLTDAAAILEGETGSVWIDSDERTEALEKFLEATCQLHPLMLEDIFADRQTPKIEDHSDYVYIVMHAMHYAPDEPEGLGTVEVDIVIGSNWVFTHHSTPLRAIDDVFDDLRRSPRLLERGPAFIAHGIMDRLTDQYLPVVDRFDEVIDELETRVIEHPTPDLLARIFSMKRAIQRLRRTSIYQREILQRLSRGEFPGIPEPALVFFRDVYDHFVRISDLADSYRELLANSLDMYMSVTANKTNDIMKFLAIISTVMLPLTFIAGVYGMNFEHMPELKWMHGYPMALALMASVAALFMVWFRHKGWIRFREVLEAGPIVLPQPAETRKFVASTPATPATPATLPQETPATPAAVATPETALPTSAAAPVSGAAGAVEAPVRSQPG